MGDIKGFLKVKRKKTEYRPVCERIKDFRDVALLRSDDSSSEQASRCMDCGTPFCHWGCPIGNYIPEWNDLVYQKKWEKAMKMLHATNNLPEITGRLCPALCESACVLGINDDPVTIRENELAIIEHAFKKGYIRPDKPFKNTGKKVAVVGSGPAGLACADQLNRAGHKVTVFEKDDAVGGILRYGIPDFKLEKSIIDRRIKILQGSGINFVVNMDVGNNYPLDKIKNEFDAICLACGSREPRDMKIKGRELKGIHFAMDYLIQSNRRVKGQINLKEELIDAKNKKVVVIGGGDTGADCVGTANRQGASCVVQIEVLSKPPECRTEDFPWPKHPLILKTSTSHEEQTTRKWAILTKEFIGESGFVKKLSCIEVEFIKDKNNCFVMKEMQGSNFEIEADLVILAIGFVHTEHNNLVKDLGIAFDAKGNVKTSSDYMTSSKGIFSAGDMHRGQSLIVWAISEGRRAAYSIDTYLMGTSNLPTI